MPRKKKSALEPVGKKIRKVRLEKKMSLNNLANETGFSIDYIKKIEGGDKMPPVGVLLQFSRALQIDSAMFLREDGTSKLRKRVQAYTLRTDNYAYATLTPGAENKHLKAFKVTIDSMSEHTGVGYQHEGEEFVYVLSGKVEILVGDHVNKIKTGDSLHFNSNIRHNLRNVGKDKAEMLIVIYNP